MLNFNYVNSVVEFNGSFIETSLQNLIFKSAPLGMTLQYSSLF